jgi:hypothetical protein
VLVVEILTTLEVMVPLNGVQIVLPAVVLDDASGAGTTVRAGPSLGPCPT